MIRLISELREAGVRLAIEDSKNGVRAALAANIPVLVTESSWTCRDDFTGAVTVLPNLGGVDVAALRRWHEGASRCRPCVCKTCCAISDHGSIPDAHHK